MICKNCGYGLREEWKYCPRCGNRILRIRGIFDEFFKMLRIPSSFGGIKKSGKGRRIKVKITSRSPGRKKRMKEKEKKIVTQKNLKVVEPATSVTKDDSYTKIEINMPGVENLEDIDFLRREDSVEIDAYTKDIRYFKIISLENKDLIDKDFKDEKLILRLK